jgi:hypothetical protein
MTLLVSAAVRFHSDLIAVLGVYASETLETEPERKEGREKPAETTVRSQRWLTKHDDGRDGR